MITSAIDHSRVTVTVFGEFTLADYRELEELVNYGVRFQDRRLDLLIDLRPMAAFTLDVAWEDLRFARAHQNDFRRIAVITEDRWLGWLAWLQRFVLRAEFRVFRDEADAEAWLKS